MNKKSIKRFALSFGLMVAAVSMTAGEPFRGIFKGEDFKITLEINLYEENVKVPGMEMFGPMNGYLRGTDLYCTWYVSSVKQTSEDKASIHFSNELGSETQAVELTLKDDSLLTLRQTGGSVLKKVVGKKLQKLPNEIIFKRANK